MLSLWRHPLSSDALVMTKVLKNKCWVKYRLWIIHRRCQVCGNQFKLPLAVHHTVYHMIRAFKQMDKWTTAWECPSHNVFPNKTIFKSEYKAVKAAMYLIKSWTMPIIWKLYSRQGLRVQKNSYKQIHCCHLMDNTGQTFTYIHVMFFWMTISYLSVSSGKADASCRAVVACTVCGISLGQKDWVQLKLSKRIGSKFLWSQQNRCV